MSQANINTQLQAFVNPEFGEIRSILIDGTPWLVGKDVSRALGYTNPQEAIRDHVDDEDKGVSEMLTPGGKQNTLIINESGLYALIMSSKLPSAKKFKRWVTSEVLPAIRKTGMYQIPGSGQRMSDLELAGMIRDMPVEKMPVFFDFLRVNGYKVPDCCYSPAALAASKRNPQRDVVQQFADEIFPQSQWGLFPFGALYDLYLTWFDKNQIHGKPLGKKTFINAIVSLADAGSIPGWRCPGKKCPVRPKHLMDAPEPVIAYALNPKHLVRRKTYTGLLRV